MSTDVEVTARLQLAPDKAWAVSSSSSPSTSFVAAISVFAADEKMFQEVQIQHSAGPPLVSNSMARQGDSRLSAPATAVSPAKAGLSKPFVCLPVRKDASHCLLHLCHRSALI